MEGSKFEPRSGRLGETLSQAKTKTKSPESYCLSSLVTCLKLFPSSRRDARKSQPCAPSVDLWENRQPLVFPLNHSSDNPFSPDLPVTSGSFPRAECPPHSAAFVLPKPAATTLPKWHSLRPAGQARFMSLPWPPPLFFLSNSQFKQPCQWPF